MRKLTMLIPALLTASFALPAMADHDYDEYYDSARVISVVPQIERVNYPVEQCHTEYVRESYNSRSPVGAIIGGVAGGLLGSQIGKGNGRVAGAAVGAGVGAVVGDRIGSQSRTYAERPIERCHLVDRWQTVERGYLVNYRYNGRTYTTMTDRHPGDRIDVRVSVSPGQNVKHVAYLEPGYARGGPGWGKARGQHKGFGKYARHAGYDDYHDYDD